ncbi:sensor histidine kinase [Microbacterium sp. ZW T5_45]|uniref:sensor histidine kinase n=1 Tax=Microbacterium sp. ZW T5_45 TaxID=3378080 RepID=UPI003854A66E
MTKSGGRSVVVPEDDGLRLPRPPGALRRYWARHPLFTDILIALVCLVLSSAPARLGGPELPEPLRTVLAVLIGLSVLLSCAAIPLRRRHPLIPFTAAFATEVLFLFLGTPGGTPMVTVAAYSLAVYGSTRLAWAGLGAGLAGVSAVSAMLMAAGPIDLQAAANGVLGNLVVGLIGTLIGINVGGRKRYLAAIIDRSRQLLVERDQQARLAAAAERARIAREMHDIVSHSLTVIVALSEGAAATTDAVRARAASTAAADTARSALGEMRAMLGVLRDDDAPAPLGPLTAPAPEETVRHAQQAGFPVTLVSTGPSGSEPAIEHAISRLVQEGVTNAMRHAPRASAVAVRIDRSLRATTVEIANDGVVAAEAGHVPGYGLQGLRERVAHAGGSLTHGVDPSGRWLLRAELPPQTKDHES